jgi:hypothetical protein
VRDHRDFCAALVLDMKEMIDLRPGPPDSNLRRHRLTPVCIMFLICSYWRDQEHVSSAGPVRAPEPDAIEAGIEEVLTEFGRDARAAIRVLLIAADRSSSRGFLRGWFSPAHGRR